MTIDEMRRYFEINAARMLLLVLNPKPQQLAPLAFAGPGWLALMREGKPIAMKPARPLVGDPQQATCESVEEWVWAWRDYWKPIDERTAAMYRLTIPVIE